MTVHPFPSKRRSNDGSGRPDLASIGLTLLMGAAAGLLAGVVVGHPKWGLVGSTLAGIIGGSVGSWLLGLFNIRINLGVRWLDTVATAAIGAAVVITLARLLG
jgi:uncharacterized membrane protein YeaQ/YmgE (transglycosylase-associated protein family)